MTNTKNKNAKSTVVTKANKNSGGEDYVTLSIPGVSLGTSIIISTLIFTVGIGLAIFFGLRSRPVIQGSTTTPTPTPFTYAAADYSEAKVTIDDDPSVGSKDAKVIIVEFSDFICPYCKKFVTETYPQIKKDYIDTGKARLIFMDYPLSGHNPPALNLAQYGYCVYSKYGSEMFFKYHDEVFNNQNSLYEATQNSETGGYTLKFNKSNVEAILKSIKVNISDINSCLATEEAKNEPLVDQKEIGVLGADLLKRGLLQEGQTGLGTPTFLIGTIDSEGKVSGRVIEGAQPYSGFKNVIEEQLNK